MTQPDRSDIEEFVCYSRGGQVWDRLGSRIVDGRLKLTLDGTDVALTRMQTEELATWIWTKLWSSAGAGPRRRSAEMVLEKLEEIRELVGEVLDVLEPKWSNFEFDFPDGGLSSLEAICTATYAAEGRWLR